MMHKYKARRLSVTTSFLGTDNCLIAYGFLLKWNKSAGVTNCLQKKKINKVDKKHMSCHHS